jgi:hypothetical protein
MREGHRGLGPLPSFTCVDPSSKRAVTRPTAKAVGQDKALALIGAFVRVSLVARRVFGVPGASADWQGGALRVWGRGIAQAALTLCL